MRDHAGCSYFFMRLHFSGKKLLLRIVFSKQKGLNRSSFFGFYSLPGLRTGARTGSGMILRSYHTHIKLPREGGDIIVIGSNQAGHPDGAGL